MANVGDVFKMTHSYTYLGQECKNVFFYRIQSSSATAISLYDIFNEYENEFQTQVLNTFNTGVTLTSLAYENLTDGLDIGEYATNATGAVAGEALPSFVAMNVKLVRDNKLTRNGSKRFVGLSENQVTDNTINILGAQQTNIENFCRGTMTLSNFNGQGDDIVLQSVIVGRTKNANGVYEIDLTRVNDVIDASMSSLVTTQNTRKA